MAHLKDVRTKCLPDLGQKWQESHYFQEFNFSYSRVRLKVTKLIII